MRVIFFVLCLYRSNSANDKTLRKLIVPQSLIKNINNKLCTLLRNQGYRKIQRKMTYTPKSIGIFIDINDLKLIVPERQVQNLLVPFLHLTHELFTDVLGMTFPRKRLVRLVFTTHLTVMSFIFFAITVYFVKYEINCSMLFSILSIVGIFL